MGDTMNFILIMTAGLLHASAPQQEAPTRAGDLDERIDPSRITEVEPAPAAELIAQPLPAAHRIAGDPTSIPLEEERYLMARHAIAGALDYLSSKQAADGSWLQGEVTATTDEPTTPAPVGVAVTALAVKAFAQSGTKSPQLDRGIDYLLQATGTEQGFALGTEGRLGTYVASAVGSALASIDDPLVADRLASAIAWLKTAQWDEGEGLKANQDWYGGVGYGNRGRPDLSNTQMMLDALHDAGVSPEDPSVQRALQFVSRTQNLKSSNGADWARNGSNDGGFIYTAANGGESLGSEYAGEGRNGEFMPEGEARSLRSYGSMTYAGFKSLLYAGLTSEDPRVRAAFDWIRRHWTFAENPGLGQQGWFYYLHAMSRALGATQQPTITTPDGTIHVWREELIDPLSSEQRPDGSWVNTEPRWMEDDPVLATIYATLALQEALKPARTAD
jgi:squalene-hopene/tetraprenyl-beta-curcumene cyclase